MTASSRVTVVYRGREHHIDVAGEGSVQTVGQLAQAIEKTLQEQVTRETMKLVVPHRKGALMLATTVRDTSLQQAGIHSGMRLMLLASSAGDVAAVRSGKDLSGMASFEQEALRAVRRRRSASAAGPAQPPSGPFTFQSYQALQPGPGRPALTPPPSQALALLHRLAADPGIRCVMTKHQWSVGLLSEMPPEGRVGVSAVCVLGFNVNRGQEIALRLRTDDMAGLRKYIKIRETLVHELAHMVHGDHDVHFKALNSQLLKEVAQCEAAAGAPGRRLLDAAAAAAEEEEGSGGHEREEGALAEAEAAAGVGGVMSKTSRLSGRTLRQIAGGAGTPAGITGRLAADAALRRWRQQQQEQQQQQGVSDTRSSGPLHEEWEQAGHYDPATEAAEQQLRSMGLLDVCEGGEGDALAAAAEQQHQQLWEEQRRAEALTEAAEAATHGATFAAPPAGAGEQGGAAADTTGAAAVVDAVPSAAVVESMDPSAGPRPRPTVPPTTPTTPAAAAQATAQLLEGQPSDPAAAKLHAARLLLLHLDAALSALSASAAERAETLDALHSILSHLVLHPEEERYRRLRLGNAAFQRRVGRHAPALQLLHLAGFEQQGQGGDAALVYVRNDPGLVYLTRAAVQEQQEWQREQPQQGGSQ